MKRWKEIEIVFGQSSLNVKVPPQTEILTMRDLHPLPDPQTAVENALRYPIGAPPLGELVRIKGSTGSLTVAIAVSDITRPVPYRGERGILLPLLSHLERAGVKQDNIRIVVATGMHRMSTREEKIRMYGEEVVGHYSIEDHNCEDTTRLKCIGRTKLGTTVSVNKHFCEADLKICTGLVESHFMAGFSGGRKSICPGLVDKETVQHFHGPDFLENTHTDNLLLEGNPCHEEALEVAMRVGVDFILNVTADRNFYTTGVYAGEMVQAHLKACEAITNAVSIPIDYQFDIVITHGGYVGLNHYQTAKAACNALPAVQDGGKLIIVADNYDVDPIGSPEYRILLQILKLQGVQRYVELLREPFWKFTKDQWEPEMWGRALRKVGEGGIIYCSPNIPKKDYVLIPAVSGYTFLGEELPMKMREAAQVMTQRAIVKLYEDFIKATGKKPTVAYLQDGPYGVAMCLKQYKEEKG